MNVIASQRALGYANHLKKFGFEPTILTFDWSKPVDDQYCTKEEFKDLILIEQNDSYSVLKIPVLTSFKGKMISILRRIGLGRLAVLYSWWTGGLDLEPMSFDFRKAENHYLKNVLKPQDYDFYLGISSPHFHARNLYQLNKSQKVNYGLDFRDLWSNRIMNKKYAPTRAMKIQDRFTRKFWRKWSSQAKTITITSRPWADKLAELIDRKVDVITNGYEPSDVDLKAFDTSSNPTFKIVHTGSIYHQQRMDMLIDGLREFVVRRPEADIKLYLIGARRGNEIESKYSFNPRVENMLKASLDDRYWEVTDRIERKDSIQSLLDAELLLFPSFPDTPGTYSGKIFEYLMVKKNILMFPGDNDVCQQLINETNSGRICDNSSEISQIIEEMYDVYLSTAALPYNGNGKIETFTRENQTRKLSEVINESLKI